MKKEDRVLTGISLGMIYGLLLALIFKVQISYGISLGMLWGLVIAMIINYKK